MRSFLLSFVSVALLAAPSAAQTAVNPNPTASPKPTKVVMHSGRLVTARTSNGGTQSFNCNTPENKKRKVCRR